MAKVSNILLILTDQQRRDTLGCYGNPVCRTPHLDSIAAEGVRFDWAFTNTAICTAVRATLLTGMEPHKHGMLANFERNVGYPWELPEGLVLFNHYLAQAGYRCGVVGTDLRAFTFLVGMPRKIILPIELIWKSITCRNGLCGEKFVGSSPMRNPRCL